MAKNDVDGKMKTRQNWEIEYYVYIDYSERLVGYIIINKERITNILPRVTKLHHYKDIKYKKGYIKSAKLLFEKNKIADLLLKSKIRDLKDNLSIFVDVIDFVEKHDFCRIFVSVDNNQFNAFSRLLGMVKHQEHVTIVKESDLKKGSVEYKLSLIIDTMLNIERLSK